MIISFYRIIGGYLRLLITGENKEKVLALCAQNGITLWNTRLSEDGIESSASVKEFKALRYIMPKNARVHILRKRGLPFITGRYKRRYGIAVGAVLFFAILQLLSSYVWVIDVTGNHKVSEKEILNACQSIGIHQGIKKDSIYPKMKRESLLLKLPQIAWGSINLEGSRITVNVTEAEVSDGEKGYSNLKASCDGIIEKLDIISGTGAVSVGQAVKKGDLLVSGIVETVDGTRFVTSRGTVTAKVKREIILSEDFSQKTAVPTGQSKTKYAIEVFGFKLPLYLGSEKGNYESKTKTTDLELFGSRLPIKIYEKTFKPYTEKEINYTYQALMERLNGKLEIKEGFKVISKDFEKTEKGVMLIAVIEGTENIEYEDNLLINAGN